ncbi:uncharacterized protein CG3556-like isoform X2 [Stegodyphus dumicola]|uniref:uncharacterized protein CG3556-like isoform X2 n=1 Tax=Stegodyphus dumicola TaxID=202533 RepID=UPI0015AA477C|nr:uncharacterized protein CG3556-like isoform X2 [Stegodyphus dumicola]
MSPSVVLICVLSFSCIGKLTETEAGASELSLRPTVLVVRPHVDLLPEIQRAVRAAVNWLLRQRKQDFSWGSSTSRAIVALSLADEVIQVEPQELQLMKKQLNILLSIELMKNEKNRKLSLGRLAQYINALYATCQDPRYFQGINLIKKLRSDTRLARAKNDFSLPIVFLTLCLAEECEEKDLDSLVGILKMNGDKLDLKSISLMAMSCITELHGFRHRRSEFLHYLRDFQYKLEAIAVNDIYTRALILQALLSGDKNSYDSSIINSTSLLRLQREDGSFGDILATYYVIPALLNENLQSLKHRKCEHEDVVGDDFLGSYAEDSGPVIKITYSLWIENGNDVDVHSMEIEFKGNKSFYDIMKMAKKRNHLYRFLFYESDDTKAVYSIAGIPDDPEKGKYWVLYVSNASVITKNKKHLQKITKGIDKTFPSNNNHFVFWWKSAQP